MAGVEKLEVESFESREKVVSYYSEESLIDLGKNLYKLEVSNHLYRHCII